MFRRYEQKITIRNIEQIIITRDILLSFPTAVVVVVVVVVRISADISDL
jgi:hypothetical protein